MIMIVLDHSPIDLEEIDFQTTNAADWVQLEEAPLLRVHDLKNFESQKAEEWEESLLVLTLKSLRLLVTNFF